MISVITSSLILLMNCSVFFSCLKYCFLHSLCFYFVCPTSHLITCYFVGLFIALNSFMISVITSSLILLMNCSVFFSCLKYCFLHSLCFYFVCPTSHLITCYFVGLFIALNAFMISVIMPSLIPLINCSFSVLSLSLSLFVFTLICLNTQAAHLLLSTFNFFSYQHTV